MACKTSNAPKVESKGNRGAQITIAPVKTKVILLVPKRSIKVPPWMESNRDRMDLAPTNAPIFPSDIPSVIPAYMGMRKTKTSIKAMLKMPKA